MQDIVLLDGVMKQHLLRTKVMAQGCVQLVKYLGAFLKLFLCKWWQNVAVPMLIQDCFHCHSRKQQELDLPVNLIPLIH